MLIPLPQPIEPGPHHHGTTQVAGGRGCRTPAGTLGTPEGGHPGWVTHDGRGGVRLYSGPSRRTSPILFIHPVQKGPQTALAATLTRGGSWGSEQPSGFGREGRGPRGKASPAAPSYRAPTAQPAGVMGEGFPVPTLTGQ